MSLNKAKGNMYGDITHTWNPLSGKCPHGCHYCSTQKFYYPSLIAKYSGMPRIDEKAINDDLGKGRKIFVCAQTDLMADGVSTKITDRIINRCLVFNENEYQIQTKNPKNIFLYYSDLPKNFIIGTTIETNRYYAEMGLAPDTTNRASSMSLINNRKYVTVEPIMDFDLWNMTLLILNCKPEKVYIGANTFKGIKLTEPSKDKILELILNLEKETTVIQKTNLSRLLTK